MALSTQWMCAQTVPLDPPAFASPRSDDADRDVPLGTIAPCLKRMELDDGVQVSFGGEVRQRSEAYDNQLNGRGPVPNDTYDLSRVLAFTELRFVAEFRVFVKLGSHATIATRSPLAGRR